MLTKHSSVRNVLHISVAFRGKIGASFVKRLHAIDGPGMGTRFREFRGCFVLVGCMHFRVCERGY